jgi:mitogen-activated protein kinase 1/3
MSEFRRFALEKDGGDFWVPSKYKVEVEIGSGSFGTVCRVRDETVTDPSVAPTHYAIKKITWTDYLLQYGAVDLKTLRELITLSHVRGHVNIVMLYDIYIAPGEDPTNFRSVYLILELMATDLRQYVSTSPTALPENVIATIIYQLLRALGYLHRSNIIHRDVASKNILLDATGVVRLTDFGLARENSTDPKSQYVVTRYYRAPENVSMDDTYSFQTDIFAAGVVMSELYLRQPLFFTDPTASRHSTAPTEQLMMRIRYLGRPPDDRFRTMASDAAFKWVQKHCPSLEPTLDLRAKVHMASDEGYAALRAMLEFHPDDRPTSEQVMAMPFFDNVREELERDYSEPPVRPLGGQYEAEAKRVGVRQMIMRAMDQLRAAPPFGGVEPWF